MTSVDLTQLSAAELQVEREKLEVEIRQRREWLRLLVQELNKRHSISQLRSRYGKAADLLLAVMSPDEIYAKLSELVKSGKLVEKTTNVSVTSQANIDLG